MFPAETCSTITIFAAAHGLWNRVVVCKLRLERIELQKIRGGRRNWRESAMLSLSSSLIASMKTAQHIRTQDLRNLPEVDEMKQVTETKVTIRRSIREVVKTVG